MAPEKEMKDESVVAVKEMLAELVGEKDLLVARLNDLHSHIEGDQNLTSRVLRQAEWMEEKGRTVARLSKVAASLWDLLEDDPRGGMAREPSLGSSRSCHESWSQDLSDARPQPSAFKNLFGASPDPRRVFKAQGSFKNVFRNDQADAVTNPLSRPSARLHRTRRQSVVLELLLSFTTGHDMGVVRMTS
ncbi:hypothetical protein T484DRAFT_1751089 [Baffinella frigidus]|nr:hypothetical protein T484DRAFT_1751089 [Cryptophyta sp. CCMP2293]